ncbi:MAG: hypothetical protein A6D92_14360 [Symbiobacterium thermophilum]|uniref:Ribonucleotide reductase large subunit C-terminal domain-containing protein n=1 Tax=Symbiobacterium thermophilum TaxID=2734 RepID=A0A1Y2T4T4_SYMTR|nr:MAG: hypothetical protein A6D92_14360 [Symbiobacterium thermophilum]
MARTATRFLDNVIDANKYPLPQIAEKALRDRRIGLGIMGWAEMLVQMGLPYDSEEAVALGNRVMTFIKQKALEESMALAEVRGPYPEWEGSQWHKAGLKVRNATLTTVAPTGTISCSRRGRTCRAPAASSPSSPWSSPGTRRAR